MIIAIVGFSGYIALVALNESFEDKVEGFLVLYFLETSTKVRNLSQVRGFENTG